MKCHILLSVLFALALLAPLNQAAPVEADEAEELARGAPGEPVDAAEEPLDDAEELGDSNSDESGADPKVEISNDYYIDVNDKTRPPHPWWW